MSDESRLLARILRRLRPAGGRLLDFGCGEGDLLGQLSEHFECFGFDPSALARSRSRLSAPDAVVLEDWESLAAGSIDLIVSVGALERLARPLPVLQALAERLVPNGCLLLVAANPGGIGRRLKGEAWFGRHGRKREAVRSRGEWVTMVKRAGLDVLWVRGDGMWDPPYVGFLPLGVQSALFGLPGALQLVSPFKRPFLPATLGECLIVAAEKQSTQGG